MVGDTDTSFAVEIVRKFLEDQETAASIKHHNSTMEHQEAIHIRGEDRAEDEQQLCSKALVGQANCLCIACLNAECLDTWLEQVRWGREKQGWHDTLVAWTQAWRRVFEVQGGAPIPFGAPGYPPAPLPSTTLSILRT